MMVSVPHSPVEIYTSLKLRIRASSARCSGTPTFSWTSKIRWVASSHIPGDKLVAFRLCPEVVNEWDWLMQHIPVRIHTFSATSGRLSAAQ